MILILSRYTKIIALTFYLLLYGELVSANWTVLYRSPIITSARYFPIAGIEVTPGIPDKPKLVSIINKRNDSHQAGIAVHKPFTGGPSQPEMQSFQSVNANNMVDLFSGDFSYNIPLMDVGGYPINIGYRSGISMDQEASWVGLGWNINPGTITRNMRGLPDDFDGKDSVRKVTSIKENRTIGVNTSVGFELAGLPLNLNVGMGIFHNTYKGWGLETSLNASLNSGNSAKGPLTGGLSLTNNTDEGVTITPSLSVKIGQNEADNTGTSGSFSLALPYNTRYGLKGLQMDVGVRQSAFNDKNQPKELNMNSFSNSYSSFISFASPSYSPSISIPYTSRQFTYTAKLGAAVAVAFPNFSLGGYLSQQFIAPRDTLQILPAYGYLYYQDGARNSGSLLDYNREKEMPYREKPDMPHIALPIYTYDAFSITGEGTGGMFRAYRGDIGFVFDHYMRTRDESDRLSGDVGLGNLVHLGTDLNVNRTFTQNGPWLAENSMKNVIAFKDNDKNFEAAYFRNPGEKSINSKKFYNAIGGDDVVTVKLFQSDKSSPVIQATNYLTRYRNKKVVEEKILKADSAIKTERDKRTQVISYLTAREAGVAGLSKYIENYEANAFNLEGCSLNNSESDEGSGTGLLGEYYRNEKWQGAPSKVRVDNNVDRNLGLGWPDSVGFVRGDYFSIRWLGRLKAPVTGTYSIYANTDDGVQVWMNDSCIITHIEDHSITTNTAKNVAVVNLLKDEFYTLKIEYREIKKDAAYHLEWKTPGSSTAVAIPKTYLYLPAVDTLQKSNNLTREKRINVFRKPNHLSEIDVLNNDGRKYVYGIPVYNFKQKEATFALNANDGNTATGLAHFTSGQDNTTNNHKGKDNFFSSEESPAYAHSFLLTGILSPDYVDLTSNGITDDDLGDAVRINYSKISGVRNPFKWRLPYITDSVTYNEGLKTYDRDDKGNYVYGEKELWYLHSIQSKTMVATFVTECRKDLLAIDEAGHKYNDGTAKRLKEINLYSKADLLRDPGKAKPIKTVHFEYSYELCRGMNKPINDSGKLTLKRIWFTYNGNKKGKQNPYVFNYNTKNERYNTRNYDRWGNFKDPADNPGSKGSSIVPNAEYPYALQDSVKGARNVATWSLDSIYLPSGGSIKVNFESDDYAYVQNRRAMEMFRVIGLANTSNINDAKSWLYDVSNDYRYVFLRISRPVTNVADIKKYYLKDLKKIYFKLFVKMPDDIHGKGNEYVPGYADLSEDNAYGMVDANRIWIRLAGMSVKGDGPGNASPLAKTAIQFLRLNLPSKAYPGAEAADNLGPAAAVRLINGLGMNMVSIFRLFENSARGNGWARDIDTSRSFVRLLTPSYKKMGGGHRVKRITIYDNWNKMTGQRTTKYGQEYTYTTREEIDGVEQSISSGVAIYEPGIGGEENPFHEPIEYVEKIAPLGPITLGYSEEPLGESLFPSPGIGYSQVRVRTINYKNIKSANGYEETNFYTARDFPTFTDRSIIDINTKKRFKPGLSNFLRINARHFLAFSQGFKIELNDMHGKLKSQATYSELDALRPVTYTKNVYRVENQQMDQQRLNNTVTAISPDGSIDTTAVIGKDVELMVDMREQLSVNNGANIHINLDIFAAVVYPVYVPSFYMLPQREETKFRSVAVTKVIQRYGILDSVIHIDKGSMVSTKDLAYDGETGNPVLTQTQNEFNDPIYNFNYPSHWAYPGMGMAYTNIGLVLSHVNIRDGKIISAPVHDSLINQYFVNGDELLVDFKKGIGNPLSCVDTLASFRNSTKIWAVNVNATNGGSSKILFIDQYGKPVTGKDINLKVVRSGKKNIFSSIGSVTSLKNPFVKVGNQYVLQFNDSSKIVNSQAITFNDKWKTAVACTTCAVDTSSCIDVVPASYQPSSYAVCFSPTRDPDYSQFGTLIHSSTADMVGSIINTSNLFWRSTNDSTGPLNRVGIWQCGGCTSGNCSPVATWIGFSHQVYVPVSRQYYIGMAGDNQIRVIIDGNLFDSLPSSLGQLPFKYWHIYPVFLTAGFHTIKVDGWNDASQAIFGAEIYNATESQIRNATSYAGLDTLFSTRSFTGSTIAAGYSCPIGYTLDSSGGNYICTRPAAGAKEINNPFTKGVFNNWRQDVAYTYYNNRSETDPAQPTNIRQNGTFSNFTPFWNFQGKTLRAQPDTTRWIWNAKVTLYNSRGFEVENKDALERYNSGIYGYNNTLPVAVVQNSHYRESAFDGFEDYNFSTQSCGTICSSRRHLNFEKYKHLIDSTQKHSGKYSLRVTGSDTVAIAVKVVQEDDNTGINLSYAANNNNCVANNSGAISITLDTTAKIPVFSPIAGKKMLLSAWVKEDQPCNGNSYTNNEVLVSVSGTANYLFTLKPSGNIIEGWQRYEGMFNLPSGDTSMTINLKATGTATLYYDDIRIQPYNANMKSFVYNPVNLRLMAELDENNYATFYEYDDDGTLTRVKKETERGIQTIKETRSALIKQ